MTQLNAKDLGELVNDMVKLKVELETLQTMRTLMDLAGGMYGKAMKTLDLEERAADEDLSKLSEITEKRMAMKEQEASIDSMVRSVKQQEDTVIPHAIEVLDKIFKMAEIN